VIVVSQIEIDDAEVVVQEEQQQCVGMFLRPGSLDLGFSRSSIMRTTYDTGEMFIFPRWRRAFVRRVGAHFLFVKISDVLIRDPDDEGEVVRIQCKKHLKDGRLQGLMLALAAEQDAGFPNGPIFLDSIELAMSSVLMQAHSRQVVKRRSYKSGLTPLRLRKVTEIIHESLHRDLSLQQLADEVHLSVSHFSRMFRTSMGLSPHQYVLKQRVNQAKEMIRRSDIRVQDVAVACGFKNQQHFARVFRSECGASPTEYRRL
jgi:AraC family transcriptional regulator